jgi:hypothetical protein
MEIGKMLDDIRNVLAPQIAAQPAQPNAALAHVGDSFRNVLNPDSAVKPLASVGVGNPETRTGWGYNDDKIYYTDATPDESLDTWTDYLVFDNNNLSRKRIQVMTTLDGGGDNNEKIAAVREYKDGKWVEHRGVEDISKFFKDNFEMDSGDYSVLKASSSMKDSPFYQNSPTPIMAPEDNWYVEYDKKYLNTPFIPSQIFIPSLSNNRPGRVVATNSQFQPVIFPQPDTRAMSVTDFLRLMNKRSMGVPLLDAQPKWWRGKEDVTPVAPRDAFREGNESFGLSWNV